MGSRKLTTELSCWRSTPRGDCRRVRGLFVSPGRAVDRKQRVPPVGIDVYSVRTVIKWLELVPVGKNRLYSVSDCLRNGVRILVQDIVGSPGAFQIYMECKDLLV